MLVKEPLLMIEVTIPSMEREVDESGKLRKVRTRSVISVVVMFIVLSRPQVQNGPTVT